MFGSEYMNILGGIWSLSGVIFGGRGNSRFHHAIAENP